MAEEERRILICKAVVDRDTDETVPGSIIKWCAMCAAEVWIAPSGQKMLVPENNIVCVPCGVGMAKTEADPRLEPVKPEQLAELRALRKSRKRG